MGISYNAEQEHLPDVLIVQQDSLLLLCQADSTSNLSQEAQDSDLIGVILSYIHGNDGNIYRMGW